MGAWRVWLALLVWLQPRLAPLLAEASRTSDAAWSQGRVARPGRGRGAGRVRRCAADPPATEEVASEEPRPRQVKIAKGVELPVAIKSLATVFEREPNEEIQRRKAEGSMPLERLGDDARVVVNEYALPVEVEPREGEGPGRREVIALPLPRPPWQGLPQEAVLEQEERFFNRWITGVYRNYTRSRLNFFEHNFEVWRQIWRTTERADAFLFILDARMPLFHFSLALFRHLEERFTQEAGPGPGNIVVVINKADLVPPEFIEAWRAYFSERFPGVPVVPFFVPKSGSARLRETGSVAALLDAIGSRRIVKGIAGRMQVMRTADFFRRRRGDQGEEEEDEQRFRHPHTLTVALIGDPNMGKSSVINAVFGKKVVSSSATPGHTKHFQTHFLPLRRLPRGSGDALSDVCFMDSPGIVVPKLDVPRAVQVVFGSYRIANLREPYSVIRWLVESGVGLVGRYKLHRFRDPDAEDDEPWSPLSVCEAYARKRSFLTKKGGTEPYRAANNILRDALNGWGLVACYLPPGREGDLPFMREVAHQYSQLTSEEMEAHRGEHDDDSDSSDETATDSEESSVESVGEGAAGVGRDRRSVFVAFAFDSEDDSSDS